ncbi:hypothetical protein PR048_006775, partial [Dryococelus australis]
MDIAHATSSGVGHSNDHPSLLLDKTDNKGINVASKSSVVRFTVSPKDITPLPGISAAQRSRRVGEASSTNCWKKPLPNAPKSRSCKRRLVNSSSSDESDDVFNIVSDSSGEEDNDAVCLFCGCVFSDDKHGEQWIQCTVCYRWAHEHCSATDVHFVCPQCRKR